MPNAGGGWSIRRLIKIRTVWDMTNISRVSRAVLSEPFGEGTYGMRLCREHGPRGFHFKLSNRFFAPLKR